MRRIGLGILALLVAGLWLGGTAPPAAAQQVNLYCYQGPTNPQWAPCASGNPLVVSASVSASITGFPGTTQTTGTPIAVTTGGVTGTLPAGAEVVASNVGATNGAYCKLGASATTSDQLIPPNSWFGFTVGTNTQLTCITSTSTTTVNMVGGSGLPTGSGGGGGGSGSSGAVFGPTAAGTAAANPPVLCGGTVDGTATGAVKNCHVDANLNLDIDAPSGSALLTVLNGINTNVAAPTAFSSQYPVGSIPITASNTGTTGATTATLAASASLKTYVCWFSIRANANAAVTADSTVTGTVTGTLHFTQWTAPNASGLGITEMIFNPCVPSSAINTGIAVISAAPSTGGVVSVSAGGYQL